ncbi:DUF4386 domain-containing protein [Undibacterium sp.]|uniref:DUF4386 domain-containing protein n=1 Tax=Undibacterium sp. TaxID=1914977 RepID=UPI003750F206
MQYRKMIVIGGASFVVGALAFVFVFSYLAANFNYPKILDGSAAEVLPRLQDGGSVMRAVWAIYAFLPLLLIPGAVGAYFACPSSRARMNLALIVASLGALAMCLGLMRWPSIHWALAESYLQAGAETKIALDAVFNGLNLYLGNYIGEFLGETMLAAFFMLTGWSMLDERRFPKWLGWSGIVFSMLFLLGAFRNVASSVQIIADINNALLPLWMIALGIGLFWYSRHPSSSDDAQQDT